MYHLYGDIACSCGYLLYTRPYNSYSALSDEELATFRALPGVSTEIKAIKKMGATMNKAGKAFKKVLKDKAAHYKSTIEQPLLAIKALRENTLTALKTSAEYKEFNKFRRKYTATQTQFREKHKLKFGDMRHLFPCILRCRRMTLSQWLLQRALRVGI